MTPQNWKELRAYIRHLANLLGLKDWAFDLVEGEWCDDAYDAATRDIEGKQLSRIWVSKGFRALTPEEQRHAIVHELVHAHFCRVASVLDDLHVGGILSDANFRASLEALNRHIEYGVDALAHIIARDLPFIGWGKAKKEVED